MVTISSDKTDLMRSLPSFFRAPRKPEVVDLPEASYLVVDGTGSPDAPLFQEAIGSLFSVAYTVKITLKKAGKDFKVATFGGSWWIGEPEAPLPRDQWRWQLTMMVPDYVSREDVQGAIEALTARGKQPAVPVRLERIAQGLSVQAMHIGPYDTEPVTIAKMEALMAERHLRRRGAHHEVYLSDPQRSKPENLKTLLRLPVEEIR
ncbi:MAG: GyrI-like domain-containing protein [Dehalococcoidia bacterium]